MRGHSCFNALSSMRFIAGMCPPVSLPHEMMGHTTGALRDTNGASTRCSAGFHREDLCSTQPILQEGWRELFNGAFLVPAYMSGQPYTIGQQLSFNG